MYPGIAERMPNLRATSATFREMSLQMALAQPISAEMQMRKVVRYCAKVVCQSVRRSAMHHGHIVACC